MRLKRDLTLWLCVMALLAACAGPAATPAAPAATATPPAVEPTDPAPTLPRPTVTPTPALQAPTLPYTAYDAILRDRVAAGAFTYEEGLLAALRAFAGEGSHAAAFGDVLPLDDEASELFQSAQEYLTQGDDPAIQGEFQRLLGRLTPGAERLLPYAAPQPAPAASGRGSGLARAWRQDDEACEELWQAGFPPGQDLVCILYTEAALVSGDGRVFYPAAWWPNDPKLLEVLAATNAMVRSAEVFAQFGQTGSVDMIFVLLDDAEASTPPRARAPGLVDDRCQIIVYPTGLAFSQTEGVEAFQQIIAHEMFHCLQHWSFPGMAREGYRANKWWIEGSAEYFSNVVYPSVNKEWLRVSDFNVASAMTPIHEMAYENTVFFQHLANEVGDQAVVDLLKSFPASTDPQASLGVLASYPNMPALFHRFARDAADQTIIDTGGDFLPTDLLGWSTKRRPIEGDRSVPLEARPFVLSRTVLEFMPRHVYQLVSTPSGADGLDSAEPEGVRQAWDAFPTTVIADCGKAPYLFVLTTTHLDNAGRKVDVNITRGDEAECHDTPPFTSQTACDHPYLPLRPGATWTYAWTNGRTFTWRVTSVQGDVQSATALVTRTDGNGVQTDYRWTCSRAVGLSRHPVRLNLGGGLSAQYTALEVNGRFLLRPAMLTPGTEWGFSATLRGHADGARHGPLTAVIEDRFTLLSEEAVTVLGRTLPGLQIDQDGYEAISAVPGLAGPPIEYHYVVELALGVGVVRRGDFETLVSYSIPD